MKKYYGVFRIFYASALLLTISTILSILLPVSSAGWRESLGISGDIQSILNIESETHSCTYPHDYWAAHPELWQTREFKLEQSTIDLDMALSILRTPPSSDTRLLLTQQIIAAILNIQNGTNPQPVARIIESAASWLDAHPIGSSSENSSSSSGYTLAAELQAYNIGQAGIALCEDWYEGLPEDAAPQITQTITATQAPTIAPTSTLTPFSPATQAPVNEAPQQPTKTPTPSSTPPPTATLPPPIITPVQIPETATATLIALPALPTLAPTPKLHLPTPAPIISVTPSPTPSATATAEPVCLHTLAYWLAYPQEWPIDELLLGKTLLEQRDLLDILNLPENEDDLIARLAIQQIVAKLNLENGTDPYAIAETVTETDIWLIEHPFNSELKEEQEEEGLALLEKLLDYNLGESTPQICEEVLPTPTPTNTSTPLANITPAETPLPTKTPTAGPYPTFTPKP